MYNVFNVKTKAPESSSALSGLQAFVSICEATPLALVLRGFETDLFFTLEAGRVYPRDESMNGFEC